MVARSGISFAELRQLLLDLGFAQSKRGTFWLFEHPISAMTFAYRPYRAKEKVTQLDIHVTRQDLDASGLLAPEAFDDLLEKATA